jgi:hypothetical protein
MAAFDTLISTQDDSTTFRFFFCACPVRGDIILEQSQSSLSSMMMCTMLTEVFRLLGLASSEAWS